ncbi:hypothetical protein [Mesorhizobium sp.]|uniref:hypothetical protein n=1 Tax=Mesorhizobium sp. TaxID=1871066 RepID=UPI000FE2F048|nr:hypothetical protein [Mesorhizobium sp.]RWJ03406.1 MAG: hypothetical protein EOR24_32005 [Mesorhizobium sp.]
MQSYDVRLIKSVTHKLQAVISVTASSEEDAQTKALEFAKAHSIQWSEPLIEEVVETAPTVDDVEIIVDLDNP